jgi:hypothetical protein
MRRLILFLAPLSLGACAPEPTASVPGPVFDFLNNPDNGNPRVFRYQDEFAVAWTDPGSGLRATHWTSRFLEEPGCGDFEGGPIAFQEIGLIDADDFFASQIRANVLGDVWIIVRDLNQAGNCFGAKLVAEGWGKAHYTDNDVFGLGPDEPNANAWGYSADGVLTAPDGSTVRYAGHLRIAITGAGELATARPEIGLR